MQWTSARIRETFLEYFRDRDHRRIASLSLVPGGDQTLLFTNAGMVQFKDVFTGQREVDYGAATTSQKCLRVSGKHNDLENVGRTARHHTFFEMLGNFSFGQYFKAGAIELAWDLLTRVYGVPQDRLHVTVHPEDDEARAIWSRVSGLSADRILNDPENFWSMGDTGPCGPCSEIYFDQEGTPTDASTDRFDDGRFLEVWNLVFMQFDRDASGGMRPLPSPAIDTGMGLERLAAVLQGQRSNYDSDLFQPLIARGAELSGVPYGQSAESDVALRVIADHARAATFLIADGIYPENEGRGYVIRRVMRRAMRFGRKLGMEGPFLRDVCAEVVARMAEAYPELAARAEVIERVVTQEEVRFGRTLVSGLKRLDKAFSDHDADRVVPGDVAFELYDTHGFPLDLTEQAAGERGFAVDVAGFEAAMATQREKGRASWKGAGDDQELWTDLRQALGTVEFTGYESDDGEGRVLAVVQDGTAVVTDRTPFYAESGGQVGDTGVIEGTGARFRVEETLRPVEGLVVHRGRFEDGRFDAGAQVTLQVDGGLRDQTRKNHSATHLLHWALRHVLGDHVKQRGSLVAPHRLRFDFSHFEPVTADEIRQIEVLVNDRVLRNVPVVTEVLAKEEATARGAIAFFGDKYGDTVRMLTITPDSVELCGGTHVRATGDIGLIKVVSETSISAGVRRLEAVTGAHAVRWVQDREAVLTTLAQTLGVGAAEVPTRVERLQEELREVRGELDAARARQRSAGVADAVPERIGDVNVLALVVDGVAGTDLRDMSDKARQKIGSGVVLIASRIDEKVSLLVAVTDDLQERLPAGGLVKEVAKVVGGGGGGRPNLAQAGGTRPDQIPAAIERLKEIVRERSTP